MATPTRTRVDLGKLTPHPRNARQGDVGAIVQSLEAHGQYRALVVQKSTGHIIAGNHTYRAMLALGWKNAQVDYLDVDDDEALRILLVDNRLSDLATYDESALAVLLAELAAAPSALAGTGFDADDFDDLLSRLASYETPVIESPDEIPEKVRKVTKPDDVWILGEHRLVCGDARNVETYEALMGDERAHLIWTDPPYGVDYEGKTSEALKIQNDTADVVEHLIEQSLTLALRFTKAGGGVYIAGPSGPKGVVFGNVAMRLGVFRQRLVWVKDSMVLGHSDYHYRHEDLYFGYVPGAKGRRGRGGAGWYGGHDKTSVLEFDRPKSSRLHPTMKPVALVAFCLENSTRARQIVLDCFAGSGTTLIASHQLNRRARLIEIDPHYCDVICTRFQTTTGIVPVLERTGLERSFL